MSLELFNFSIVQLTVKSFVSLTVVPLVLQGTEFFNVSVSDDRFVLPTPTAETRDLLQVHKQKFLVSVIYLV